MKRNYAIDTLRTIATLLVILLHVSGEYANKGLLDNNYNLSFWIGNILDSFSRICVPIFVLISGMFLVGRNESFKDSYKKRASRILFPLIAWTIIYLIFSATLNYISNDTIGIKSLVVSTLLGRPYYHMWYLYMIIGLYLFTPILNNSISSLSRKNLWLISIALLVFGMVNTVYDTALGNKTTFILWFVNYLGYFIIGFLIKDSKINIPNRLLFVIYIVSSLIISILSYYTATLFDNFYFYDYLTPFVIIASISIFTLFLQFNIEPNFLSKMSHLSLGIYLIHAGVLTVFLLGLSKLDIHLFDNPIVGIPVKFSLTLFLSIMIANIFYKSKFLNKII